MRICVRVCLRLVKNIRVKQKLTEGEKDVEVEQIAGNGL
jgi:hypothetical protein